MRTSHTYNKLFWSVFTCCVPAFPGAAQVDSLPKLPSFEVVDPCRITVSKFEETISFVRQSQGNKAAADLKERLIPAKLESDLLIKGGYCGLAAHLREKKLSR